MQIQFSKMQCSGNDYIAVETFSQNFYDPFTASLILTDRRFGIGADALLVVSPCKTADAKLEVFTPEGNNTDGSGCAVRCAVKLLKDQHICEKEKMTLETEWGTVLAYVSEEESAKSIWVTEEIRLPDLLPDIEANVEILSESKKIILHPVCRLNHFFAVLLVGECFPEAEGIEKINLAAVSAAVRKLPQHNEISIVLAEPIENKRQMKVRMWIPNTGEVRANANGAMAALLAATKAGLCECNQDVSVLLQGGLIRFNQSADVLKVTGPVTGVFDGITN